MSKLYLLLFIIVSKIISSNSQITCEQNKPCDIHCNGDYSCSVTTINATSSSILNINCGYKSSCSSMYVYGPSLSANIYCTGEDSCYLSKYYLSYTSNVSIECKGDDSCTSTTYYVEYSDYVHFLASTTIYNNAKGVNIYGSHITKSLIVDCIGIWVCRPDFNVYCPNTAECVINNNNDNYLNIYVIDDTYSNLEINTIGIKPSWPGSEYWLFCIDNGNKNELGYNSADNHFYCLDDSCCPPAFQINDAPISCEKNKECIIDCSVNGKCPFNTINGSLSTGLTVYCNTDFSCQGSTILCPDGGNCSIFCSNSVSCKRTVIEGNNVNNMLLHCTNTRSCNMAKLNLLNMAGSVDILCSGSVSCQASQFNIYGNDLVSNDVNIECLHQYGCEDVVVDIQSMDAVSINCTDNYGYACKDISISSSTANTFNLICNAKSGCSRGIVYCPSDKLGSCSIECGDYSYSCSNLDIKVVNDNYFVNYLSIKCPLQPIQSSTCGNIEHICPSYQTVIIYDDINDLYSCSNNGCCPWTSQIITTTAAITTTAKATTTTAAATTTTTASATTITTAIVTGSTTISSTVVSTTGSNAGLETTKASATTVGSTAASRTTGSTTTGSKTTTTDNTASTDTVNGANSGCKYNSMVYILIIVSYFMWN